MRSSRNWNCSSYQSPSSTPDITPSWMCRSTGETTESCGCSASHELDTAAAAPRPRRPRAPRSMVRASRAPYTSSAKPRPEEDRERLELDVRLEAAGVGAVVVEDQVTVVVDGDRAAVDEVALAAAARQLDREALPERQCIRDSGPCRRRCIFVAPARCRTTRDRRRSAGPASAARSPASRARGRRCSCLGNLPRQRKSRRDLSIDSETGAAIPCRWRAGRDRRAKLAISGAAARRDLTPPNQRLPRSQGPQIGERDARDLDVDEQHFAARVEAGARPFRGAVVVGEDPLARRRAGPRA